MCLSTMMQIINWWKREGGESKAIVQLIYSARSFRKRRFWFSKWLRKIGRGLLLGFERKSPCDNTASILHSFNTKKYATQSRFVIKSTLAFVGMCRDCLIVASLRRLFCLVCTHKDSCGKKRRDDELNNRVASSGATLSPTRKATQVQQNKNIQHFSSFIWLLSLLSLARG
jgi:hypothetical protein